MKYTTEQMLRCVKKNGIYPQDDQISPMVIVTYGRVGMTVTKLFGSGEKTKHINNWQNMTADEINAELTAQRYE